MPSSVSVSVAIIRAFEPPVPPAIPGGAAFVIDLEAERRLRSLNDPAILEARLTWAHGPDWSHDPERRSWLTWRLAPGDETLVTEIWLGGGCRTLGIAVSEDPLAARARLRQDAVDGTGRFRQPGAEERPGLLRDLSFRFQRIAIIHLDAEA